MQRKDFQLISESYQDVHAKILIHDLFLEGKSEEQIIEVLTEAGIWDRIKSRWSAFSPFDKENRENIRKVVGGKIGEYTQKGLKKAGELAGIDPQAIEDSKLYDKAWRAENISGSEGASAMRSKKLKSILQSHISDLEEITERTINTVKQTESEFRQLFDQIKDDLKKIGVGTSNIASLDKELNRLALDLPGSIGSQFTSPSKLADYVVDKIVSFFNKMKTNKKSGLQKAHKLDSTKIR
jgi:hypothetical protein